MNVLYAQENAPASFITNSIFLAGPTLRSRACRRCGGTGEVHHIPGGLESPCCHCRGRPDFLERGWREDALELFDASRFEGVVAVPEFRDRTRAFRDRDWDAQVEWETGCMRRATVLMFWVPREMTWLPGMTTNVEFGLYILERPCRVVLGFPEGAPHMRYLEWLARGEGCPVSHTLAETVNAALARVGG